MFSHLGNWLNQFLSGYVNNAVSMLSAALMPLALVMLTLYIANYGFAVMRGEVSEAIDTFAWKVVKFTLICGFALGGGLYIGNVSSVLENMQDGMATMFISSGGGGAFGAASSVGSAFGALDVAFQAGVDALDDLWKEAGITRLDLVVAGIVYTLGLDVFLFVAAAVVLISKIFLSFALAIGPAAILCLLFKPTSRFFDSWLSFALSAVVMTWFVFFALGMSLFVVNKCIESVVASGAFQAQGDVNGLEAAAGLLVIYVLLAVLLWQSPKLASALTGGPAVQTGASMVASYILGSVGRGSGSGGGGSGGGRSNEVQRGGGPSYGSGHAAGQAAYQRVSSLFGGGRR
ncbi:type IV secretion system protein [Aquincola sp. S2]|uniref:Type IV secretion system protein n=1 Tax=Pseudaquabacterium terrae TaxID=2732868 RepID=A0ABX2ERL9_9BURK|nr:type IV secretion system protein [Aquabacterium terrae]NRF71370.1 type IV secretion system protein [Aquabacterium terrae]